MAEFKESHSSDLIIGSLVFAPQGGWSLVDGMLEGAEGVYSDGFQCCYPLFVHCPKTRRVACCHMDHDERMNLLNDVLLWACAGHRGYEIKICISHEFQFMPQLIKKINEQSHGFSSVSLYDIPMGTGEAEGMTVNGKYLGVDACEELTKEGRFTASYNLATEYMQTTTKGYLYYCDEYGFAKDRDDLVGSYVPCFEA